MRPLVTLAFCLATTSLANAASLSTTLDGTSLGVDSPCAKQVRITPDASLHNQVLVQATADNQEELDHLLLESRGAARVRTHPGSCWQAHWNDGPTLLLDIRVPAGFAIKLDESGAGRYQLGPVGGTLSADLSGAADVEAATATALDIDLSGAGNMHVGQADGPARIDLSGHGNVVIATATMPSLSLSLSGAGHVAVTAGHIGKVSLDNSGVGSTQIGAEVGDARVDLSGVGSVQFATVTGRLEKDVSGMGSVTIGK